jgi:hypothetical protein
MKTKFLWFALTLSAATIAQANPVARNGGGGNFHGATVSHGAPPAHVAPRVGSPSSFHSMPVRNFSGGMAYPHQRYSSFAMRSNQPAAFRQRAIYPNRVTVTRSGPFIAATIRQPNGINRVAGFANHRNPTATTVWNQRNTGVRFRNANNFRNGRNRLRGDWQKHVFAQHSGDWNRNWNRNCDHWWNGHQCSFINGTWVIFNLGFSPWWNSYYPDDYYYDYGFPNDGYGSSTYGYNYPYSYSSDPGYDNSGDYQGQYYDQNGYPDQSQNYYDSMVYQNTIASDHNAAGGSDDTVVAAAQELLAGEGYYHGETDGTFTPEMQKAVKRYQITNGLRATGYLDTQTIEVMGLQKPSSY